MKDSGNRTELGNGVVRDRAPGKGRFDLMPMDALMRLAQTLEKSTLKYEERNWEQGMPLANFADSAMRHIVQHIAGDRSEDHLGQALWNVACWIQTEEWIRRGQLPGDLNNLPCPLSDIDSQYQPPTDHGILSGLADDDQPRYSSVPDDHYRAGTPEIP